MPDRPSRQERNPRPESIEALRKRARGGGQLIYLPGLALSLAALWFTLSGETGVLFLFFGLLSVLASIWLAARLGIIDRDASPWHRLPSLLVYHFWLLWEIIKSNVEVISSVLNPRKEITPATVDLDLSCRSDLAKTTFANSITLTPGTVTIDVDKGVMTVHALLKTNATPQAFAQMERLASRASDGAEGAISPNRRRGERRATGGVPGRRQPGRNQPEREE